MEVDVEQEVEAGVEVEVEQEAGVEVLWVVVLVRPHAHDSAPRLVEITARLSVAPMASGENNKIQIK